MTIRDYAAALNDGKTITIIDRSNENRWFKEAFRKDGKLVTTVLYQSIDDGKTWDIKHGEDVMRVTVSNAAEYIYSNIIYGYEIKVKE